MADKLKPCPVPWCPGRKYPGYEWPVAVKRGSCWMVCCIQCGINGPAQRSIRSAEQSWNEAVAAWNIRPGSAIEKAARSADT